MLVDSHCHLEQCQDPLSCLERAAQAQVTRVVGVSEDEASGRQLLALRSQAPGLLVGLGFHPMKSVSTPQPEIDACLAFVAENLAQADLLGEVGLDFKYAKELEQQNHQRLLLERQLELADRARKPINLHSRWAQRQTLEVAVAFTRATGLGAQLHWFTQSTKLIRIANREGVYISAGPSLLHSEEARRVAGAIDRHLMLLETDSPVSFGERPAEPAWVRQVAECLAGIWDCSWQEVAHQTTENFDRYLTAGAKPAE